MGYPSGGCARCALLQHLVDLFERETLGLWNKEVGKGQGDAAECAPHEEDFGTKVGIVLLDSDEVGSDDSKDLIELVNTMRCKNQSEERTYAVPEPIGSGGETNTTRADGKGENLANDNPCGRTPGGSEEEDVDTDKCDHRGGGRVVLLLGLAGGDTNNTDDELTNDHTHGTEDKNRAPTQSLNDVERYRGGADVNKGGDERD